MKYENQIDIALPLNKVIELFDNPNNLSKWQPGFVSFEHLSGEPGQVGAKSKLLYNMGKREVEMIETITKKDLPHSFAGTYEAKGVFNEIDNRFEALDEQNTRWISTNVFKFSGFMKFMSLFMAGSFRKQSYKFMELFKEFAESEPI